MKLAMLITLLCGAQVIGLYLLAWRQGDISSYINQLRSAEQREREFAAKAILQSKPQLELKQKVVSEVEKIAKEFIANDLRKGAAKTSISLLGDLLAQESIPFLVNNLTFEVFYLNVSRPQTKEDLFPCVGALIKIGNPSIEPTLIKVEQTDDEKTIRLAGYIVFKVLGDKAESYIADRISRQANPINRRRLILMQRDVNLWRASKR